MKTDLDAVIRAVAVNNGAGLKKTDAVMQLVTVMDAIIESHTQQLAEQQKALLVGFAEKIEASLLRVNTDMKANTEHSVHAVTEYAKDILPKVMTAGATEAVKAAKSELSAMLLDFDCRVVPFRRLIQGGVIVISVSAGVAAFMGLVQLFVALGA